MCLSSTSRIGPKLYEYNVEEVIFNSTLRIGVPIVRRVHLEITPLVRALNVWTRQGDKCRDGSRAGCVDLLKEIETRIRPFATIFGHIHEGYGNVDGQL